MEEKLAELLKEIMEYEELSKKNYINFSYDGDKQITLSIREKKTYKILSTEIVNIEKNAEGVNDFIEKIRKFKTREE